MRYIALLLVFIMTPVFAGKEVIQLGETSVTLYWHDSGAPIFVHLHESETTAWQAIRQYTKQHGGSYLHLHQSGQRNICFRQRKQRYCFDPNRIFTDKGIKQTLTTYSHQYDQLAHQEVTKLSNRIKHIIAGRPVIAVHNNQEYSMRDYMAKHSLAAEAQALHWHDMQQYRDFLLITQHHLWPQVKRNPHNAVLQAKSSTDDGSLSIWMANYAYINCEAGYGHLTQQLRQLSMAKQLIG